MWPVSMRELFSWFSVVAEATSPIRYSVSYAESFHLSENKSAFEFKENQKWQVAYQRSACVILVAVFLVKKRKCFDGSRRISATQSV